MTPSRAEETWERAVKEASDIKNILGDYDSDADFIEAVAYGLVRFSRKAVEEAVHKECKRHGEELKDRIALSVEKERQIAYKEGVSIGYTKGALDAIAQEREACAKRTIDICRDDRCINEGCYHAAAIREGK